ncbi:HTH-type transcriptional repressor YcgE [Aquisphaera giovannonii]|uniref:HTH-type transcriptional repressor YcgE n=1 Tax=Aquisphaera giovannonii TaxID=406548 RepID=A0A5B9VYA9_9BACT|nr:MerR family transcriptional regulator [Aquisphaera giovannonii]QEH32977.1 HTH-type transcriptional repressor YcgE [Aquisphaera giovannonii]
MDTPSESIESGPRGEAAADAVRPSVPLGEADAESCPGYSIAAVSKLTGISCHTLRVWERRYGFPVPERTASGHRRYSSEQVRTLNQLARVRRATDQSVGRVIAGWNLDHHDGGLPAAAPGVVEGAGGAADGLVDLLVGGDIEGAEREFERLCEGLEPVDVVDQVIEPGLVEAGEGWFRRAYPVYKERLITVFLRRKLHGLIEATRRDDPRSQGCLVIGTVQGDRHEGGVLLLNLVMQLRGWRVLNLGTDLPVREYREAVRELGPSALALSFTLSRNIKKRFQELKVITEVPVFVGGRSIVNYQSLARGYGLIPLPGPIRDAAPALEAQWRRWMSSRAGGDAAPRAESEPQAKGSRAE